MHVCLFLLLEIQTKRKTFVKIIQIRSLQNKYDNEDIWYVSEKLEILDSQRFFE